MRYQVPQFVEVEDKIFGSLTLKQFVYIGGGAGLAFIMYKMFPKFIAYPLMGGAVGLAIALAFVKINNRPFVAMMESAFMFLIKSKLYLWQQDFARRRALREKEKQKTETNEERQDVIIPNLTDNKLKSLSWSLDINEHLAVERDRTAAEELAGPDTQLSRIAQMRKDALLPQRNNL